MLFALANRLPAVAGSAKPHGDCAVTAHPFWAELQSHVCLSDLRSCEAAGTGALWSAISAISPHLLYIRRHENCVSGYGGTDKWRGSRRGDVFRGDATSSADLPAAMPRAGLFDDGLRNRPPRPHCGCCVGGCAYRGARGSSDKAMGTGTYLVP